MSKKRIITPFLKKSFPKLSSGAISLVCFVLDTGYSTYMINKVTWISCYNKAIVLFKAA